ncbi:hypothetical protein M758_1G320900 [Ceratodon purpureus]|nr:hypothetical protein M758_1G320900 [Ceratodon purpureus]
MAAAACSPLGRRIGGGGRPGPWILVAWEGPVLGSTGLHAVGQSGARLVGTAGAGHDRGRVLGSHLVNLVSSGGVYLPYQLVCLLPSLGAIYRTVGGLPVLVTAVGVGPGPGARVVKVECGGPGGWLGRGVGWGGVGWFGLGERGARLGLERSPRRRRLGSGLGTSQKQVCVRPRQRFFCKD